jgi:hypothetical protein
MKKDQTKKPRGRPAGSSKYFEHFERIPDTPENVAKAIFSTPPKKESDWDYLKKLTDPEE